MRNCIQLSEATARQIIDAGKGHWVAPREGTVSVKGKGEMQTYWLDPRESAQRRSSCTSSSSCYSVVPPPEFVPDTDVPVTPGPGMLKAQKTTVIWGTSEVSDTMPPALSRCSSDPTYRLIDWNVDVLLRLLKKVVVHRSTAASTEHGARLPGNEMFRLPACPELKWKALDEVKEIIELPNFNAAAIAAVDDVDPDSVEVNEEIEVQLRDYVTAIASMYRDNPFHNYEHACHVQMSMIKLLQRVVTPDAIDYDGGTTEDVASSAHQYTYGITSDPLTQFAVVFCALIHDVDHTGVANGQLVKENSPVAVYYDGKSVAEQNSIDLGSCPHCLVAFCNLKVVASHLNLRLL